LIAELEKVEEPRSYPKPLTPQYYLSAMAEPHETDVLVTEEDFLAALSELTPSVSQEEMKHYDKVQQVFASETLNSKGKKKEVQVDGKGKGRARD
jgi:peroxin-6